MIPFIIVCGLYFENYEPVEISASQGLLILGNEHVDNFLTLDGEWLYLKDEKSTPQITKIPIRFKKDKMGSGIGV